MAHSPRYVTAAYRTNPLSALAAGKTGEPQVITSIGGTDAGVSKLLFAGIFLNNDTFTVGGTVFTAKTSGAAGAYEFNITGVLSTDIDNLIAKLAVAPVNAVQAFTFTKTDTNTAVSATPKLGSGVNGNTAAGNLSSTHSTTTPTYSTTGVATPAISLDTESTILNHATGGKATIGDFLNGLWDEGQDKNIVNIGAGTWVVAMNVLGGVQMTLTTGQTAFLTYLGGKWQPIYKTGTIA